MVLGLGAYKLAKSNAVIKRLRAAETLGSVTVIATDKTGTITENKMMLSEVFVDGKGIDFKSRGGVTPPLQDDTLKRLIEIGVFANDAYEARENDKTIYIGDPIDAALLTAIKDKGLNPLSIKEGYKFVTELPFDNTRKMVSVLYSRGGLPRPYSLKGSPDAILSRSTRILISGEERGLTQREREEIQNAAADMAGRALRVIAVGYRNKVGAIHELPYTLMNLTSPSSALLVLLTLPALRLKRL